jgi:hypothetical protein
MNILTFLITFSKLYVDMSRVVVTVRWGLDRMFGFITLIHSTHNYK